MIEINTASDRLYPEVFADGRFGRYSLSAFHDIRDKPQKMQSFFGKLGRFNEFNADVTNRALLKELTPFVMENEWFRKFVDDIICFDPIEIEAAREYCRRLAKHGRWAHAWDGEADWQVKLRKEKLTVRLVREQRTHLLEVIT